VDAVLLAASWRKGALDEAGSTVEWLQAHGIPVVLFGPTNLYQIGLPSLLVNMQNDPAKIGFAWDESTVDVDRSLAGLAATQWHIRYISPFEDLCTPEAIRANGMPAPAVHGCPLFAAPGVPLLFDTRHLTPQASDIYVHRMVMLHQLP
jgi:hypothetical protein